MIIDRDADLGRGKRTGLHAADEVGCRAPGLESLTDRRAVSLHVVCTGPHPARKPGASPTTVVGQAGAPVVSVLQLSKLREAHTREPGGLSRCQGCVYLARR
jgi:hypothetical protein